MRWRNRNAEDNLRDELLARDDFYVYVDSYRIFSAYLIAAIVVRLFQNKLPHGAVVQMWRIAGRAAVHASQEITRQWQERQRVCEHTWSPYDHCQKCQLTHKP